MTTNSGSQPSSVDLHSGIYVFLVSTSTLGDAVLFTGNLARLLT